MADMRYYGNVMTTTRWPLYVILHLQQYSRRLNFFLANTVISLVSFSVNFTTCREEHTLSGVEV